MNPHIREMEKRYQRRYIVAIIAQLNRHCFRATEKNIRIVAGVCYRALKKTRREISVEVSVADAMREALVNVITEGD